jgi:hypothetical protein
MILGAGSGEFSPLGRRRFPLIVDAPILKRLGEG